MPTTLGQGFNEILPKNKKSCKTQEKMETCVPVTISSFPKVPWTGRLRYICFYITYYHTPTFYGVAQLRSVRFCNTSCHKDLSGYCLPLYPVIQQPDASGTPQRKAAIQNRAVVGPSYFVCTLANAQCRHQLYIHDESLAEYIQTCRVPSWLTTVSK